MSGLKMIFCMLGMCALMNAGSEPAAPPVRRISVVNYVRLLNTAENLINKRQGKYVAADDLLSSPELKSAKKLFPNLQLEGTKLSLIVSSDQSHYSIIVTDVTDKCEFTVSSTEAGKIFHGTVIDCAIIQR